jgi:hypothetical protein
MSKNPANRTIGDHIKEGVKQIPKTYKGLYNQPGPMGGAKTIPNNVRVIATGKTAPGMPKKSAGLRAGLAAMGAASVTPAGPIAAFGMGINKSVKEKAAARAAANAAPAAPAPPKLKLKNPPGAAPNNPPAMPPLPATPRATAGAVPKAPPKTGLKIGGARATGAQGNRG